MGLIKKIFGSGGASRKPSPDFSASEATTVEQAKERNAPRRDLIHTVLRETVRRHGIPSEWVGCRILSVVTRQHKSGMHVQFLVHKGDEQLIRYVHAFQEAFWRELTRLDPYARQWLFSVAWQFDGEVEQDIASAPPLVSIPHEDLDDRNGPDTQPSEAGDTQPLDGDAEDLASDLQALYAIRDAALSSPAELTDLSDAKPREHKPR